MQNFSKENVGGFIVKDLSDADMHWVLHSDACEVSPTQFMNVWFF